MNGERRLKMRVLAPVLAGDPSFTLCSLEAECETLIMSNLHLRITMKRLALFTTTESCAHTLLAPQPAQSTTNQLPPSALQHHPGTTFWLQQTVVIPPLCCLAKSTCWDPFHQCSLGFFFFQYDPRVDHLACTHTHT